VQQQPVLHVRHLKKSKKIVTSVYCVNDKKTFSNCTEAGKYYSIDANQIGQCAKGNLKSVRKRKSNKKERLQFQYLDKSGNPIVPNKHLEPLAQRQGVLRIILTNQETCNKLGRSQFSSLAEYCRETGVPHKRAYKYRKDKTIDLNGYEFVEA